MGLIVSVPRIGGSPTVSPISSSTHSSSYAFAPSENTAFGLSPTISSAYNTEGTISTAVSAAESHGAPPADVTDILVTHGLISPGYTETITAYLSTVTVTSKIKVSISTSATATVVASHCPTTTVSDVNQSAPSTKTSITSAVETHTHLSLPGVSSGYNISLSGGLPKEGAHVVETSISTLSSLLVAMSSVYNGSMHSELRGSGQGYFQSSFTISATGPNVTHSTSTMRASTLQSLITGVSNRNASGLLPMSKLVTTLPTGFNGIASGSHSNRSKIVVRGCDDAPWGSNYRHCPSGRPIEITYPEGVTATRKQPAIPGTANLQSTRTLTRVKDVTTTTIFTTVTTKHTSITTVTESHISCPTRTTSISKPTFPTACTSATPNPDSRANDTCAEDGLLEYSNTPQSPDTLEDCALACLVDISCLSFTFIPRDKTCFTSLYPLADSAFAGIQDYHIYNYDRDCYSCSS